MTEPPGQPATGSSAERTGEAAAPLAPDAPPQKQAVTEPQEKPGKGRKAKKGTGVPKGVETMFRNAYRTHLELSNLADTKANIIISINGLVISILIATVASNISSNPWFLLPTAVLLLSCSAALVFAVLAARPRVSSEVVDPEQLRDGKRNLLFFGTFVNIPEEEFLEGIQHLIRGTHDLYDAMARDLYALGGVLAKKYRLIRTAYTIFMVGLVLGGLLLLTVLGAEVLAGPPAPF